MFKLKYFIILFTWHYIYKRSALLILKRPPLLAVLAGFSLAFNYFGYMKGVELTSASNAQVMIQMAPTLLAVIGFVYFKENPTRAQILGYLLAVMGFAAFYRDPMGQALSPNGDFLIGNSWTPDSEVIVVT